MEATQTAAKISERERQIAVEYLGLTRAQLLEHIQELTGEQWCFKPAPLRWSIGQNVQHLTEVEGRVHKILANLSNCADAEPGREDEQIDLSIRTDVPLRMTRIEAPEHLHPSGTWSLIEAVERFEETRAQSLQLLNEATCLRGKVFPHPILGFWDGYQWLLAGAAHCARHTAQIVEVKSDAGFPV